jgi:ketosteroid isomerase-like protein
MSQENVERVRRGIRSVEVFWGMLDEYVVWDMRDYESQNVDFDTVYVGRNTVIENSRRWWGAWTDYSLAAEELIDAGSSVVLVCHEQGRGKGSGTPFEKRYAQVWTFSRGRIVRWECFSDKADALEAAGLSE